MLEKEYKCIISKSVYDEIKDYYEWDEIREQTNNYYLDKAAELSKHKIMVRVREKTGTYKLQVKKHRVTDSPVHISEETEFEISDVPEYIDSAKAKELTGINTDRLYRIGALNTLRCSLMWDNTTEICLDKSTYFDTTDYEIEVEYSGEFPQKLMEELSALNVEFSEKGPGKYSRFIQKFKEQI